MNRELLIFCFLAIVGQLFAQKPSSMAKLREGTQALQQGKYHQAYLKFSEGIKQEAGLAELRFGKASAAHHLGMYDTAQVEIDKALALNPTDPRYVELKANVHMAKKEYDQAIVSFEQCAQMAANQSSKIKLEQIHYNIGLCHLILKNYKKGIDAFDQAVSLRDTFTEAYHNRGLCHLREGHHEQACQDWTKALKLGSTFSKKYLDEHCAG